ncbi:MAG: putative Ig domain-containing protein, partial [Verrucomicrobia bacterium]|nr:putative Ig domain-containing protein [Verrucomicrobiota bacterium]
IPSIGGSGSHTFSISQLTGLLGLNSANTYLFFGNSNPGTVFSNFSVVQETPPVITSVTTASGVYGSAFSYQITASGSPTNYAATGLPAGLSLNPASGLISGTLTSHPGTYTINLSASNAGGTGTSTLTLTETPAPLTVSANSASRTYGDANPAFTATFSGFVNGDTAAVISGSPSFSTSATASSSVGSYTVTPGLGTLSAANYSFGPLVNGALTINPAPLSVQADSLSVMYGVALPTLTGTITGIKNSDPISAVYSTTATIGSIVGTYPISLSLVDPNNRLPNYTVTALPGTLTITPAPLAAAITGPQPGYLALVNAPIEFDGSFNKSGIPAYGVSWTFQSATLPAISAAGNVVASDIWTGTVQNSVSFPSAGLYLTSLSVTDSGGHSASANTVGNQSEYVVVIDPTAGSLTGGGWVPVAAGMLPGSPTATGKGHFGLEARYAPESGKLTGHVEFEFNAGNGDDDAHSNVAPVHLHFQATALDWLVVENGRADLKGVGTLAAADDDQHLPPAPPKQYGFFLSAIPGHGHKTPAQLRLFVWDPQTGQTVFDNQANASIIDPLAGQTVLGDGSIEIHHPAADQH